MAGLTRGTFALGATLALGTWLGLGRPTMNQARAYAERVTSVPLASATPSSSSSSSLSPTDSAPLPHAEMPSLKKAPWPSSNPDASISQAWMVAEGPRHEPGDGRRLVTLTFDDGPFLETTPSVLKVLARHNVHATFFVIGQYLDGEDKRTKATRRLLKRIVTEGHLVGNHTRDHAHLAGIAHEKALEQIDDCSDSIERATGQRPILFRPPYGELDDFGSTAARERGLDVMLWSVAVEDMTRDDPHAMFKELTTQLDHKEGGMVLLHDIRFSSIAALRELFLWLDEHKWDPERPSRIGYDVVDMPTYLEAVAKAPLPYPNRDELAKAREAARAHHKKAGGES